MELLDLEGLTVEERSIILNVIHRDDELRQNQECRISQIKQEIQSLRMAGILRSGDNLSKMCARCKAPFGLFTNTGDVCPVCRFRVCKACREGLLSHGWMCVLCYKENQLVWLTGEWMRKNEKDPDIFRSGTDLIRASLRVKKSNGSLGVLEDRAGSHDANRTSSSSAWQSEASLFSGSALAGSKPRLSSIFNTLRTGGGGQVQRPKIKDRVVEIKDTSDENEDMEQAEQEQDDLSVSDSAYSTLSGSLAASMPDLGVKDKHGQDDLSDSAYNTLSDSLVASTPNLKVKDNRGQDNLSDSILARSLVASTPDLGDQKKPDWADVPHSSASSQCPSLGICSLGLSEISFDPTCEVSATTSASDAGSQSFCQDGEEIELERCFSVLSYASDSDSNLPYYHGDDIGPENNTSVPSCAVKADPCSFDHLEDLNTETKSSFNRFEDFYTKTKIIEERHSFDTEIPSINVKKESLAAESSLKKEAEVDDVEFLSFEQKKNFYANRSSDISICAVKEQVGGFVNVKADDDVPYNYFMQQYFGSSDSASDTLSIISEKTEPEEDSDETEQDVDRTLNSDISDNGSGTESEGTVFDDLDDHCSDAGEFKKNNCDIASAADQIPQTINTGPKSPNVCSFDNRKKEPNLNNIFPGQERNVQEEGRKSTHNAVCAPFQNPCLGIISKVNKEDEAISECSSHQTIPIYSSMLNVNVGLTPRKQYSIRDKHFEDKGGPESTQKLSNRVLNIDSQSSHVTVQSPFGVENPGEVAQCSNFDLDPDILVPASDDGSINETRCATFSNYPLKDGTYSYETEESTKREANLNVKGTSAEGEASFLDENDEDGITGDASAGINDLAYLWAEQRPLKQYKEMGTAYEGDKPLAGLELATSEASSPAGSPGSDRQTDTLTTEYDIVYVRLSDQKSFGIQDPKKGMGDEDVKFKLNDDLPTTPESCASGSPFRGIRQFGFPTAYRQNSWERLSVISEKSERSWYEDEELIQNVVDMVQGEMLLPTAEVDLDEVEHARVTHYDVNCHSQEAPSKESRKSLASPVTASSQAKVNAQKAPKIFCSYTSDTTPGMLSSSPSHSTSELKGEADLGQENCADVLQQAMAVVVESAPSLTQFSSHDNQAKPTISYSEPEDGTVGRAESSKGPALLRNQSEGFSPQRGSQASHLSIPSVTTSHTGSNDEKSLEDDDDNIDELFAKHQMGNRYGLGVSRSSLGDSRESLASVYSDAGDVNYGRIPVSGDITFALDYDHKASALKMHIKGCQNLAAADTKHNRSNPYVKVYLLPDKTQSGKRKTKIKRHTLNPVFSETLTYNISQGELENRTLWVAVWHNDRFGHNDFLGEVTIPLDMYRFDDTFPQTYELQSRMPDTLSETVMQYKGELIISLMYVTPDKVTETKKSKFIKSKKTKSATEGQFGSVHAMIKSAKNLTAVRSNGTSDPFVKGYLLPDPKRASKQKTPVVKKSVNPMWNHILIFDNVDPMELADRSLELTVWNHDARGNDFLGGARLNLGLGTVKGTVPVDWMDAMGEEMVVWQKMMEFPNAWVDAKLPLRASMGKNTTKKGH